MAVLLPWSSSVSLTKSCTTCPSIVMDVAGVWPAAVSPTTFLLTSMVTLSSEAHSLKSQIFPARKPLLAPGMAQPAVTVLTVLLKAWLTPQLPRPPKY